MKNLLLKLGLGILGIVFWSQCDTLSTIPPKDDSPVIKPQSKFEPVDYHIISQLHAEFLVEDSLLKMKKMGTVKPKGMNWRIELVENLNEEFYRIQSPYGTYLHVENGKLEATKLGKPGWHSAMWRFEIIDANNEVYQISNRWKSDMYLQFDPQQALIDKRIERSLRHRVIIKKASKVSVKEKEKEKDPIVDNPHLTLLNDDPLKNGHPNLEANPPTQNTTTINFGSTDAFIGQIKMFAGNFAPRGWAFCNGQVILISENTALFSLLGTTYGGDGRTTFALPDLRGRAPIHAGKTLGGIPAEYKLGNRYGSTKANIYNDKYQNVDELKKLIEVSDGVNIPNAGVETQATVAINYIIATGGTFPSRN